MADSGQTQQPPKGRGGGRKGGGRGGRGRGRGRVNTTSNDGKDTSPSKANTSSAAGRGTSHSNKNSGRGRGSAGTSESNAPKKQQQQQQQTVSPEQREKERLEKQQQAQAAADKARVEAEQRAQQKKREETTQKIKDAKELLQTFLETIKRHKQYRQQLQPDTLAQARANFVATKKTLKTDLKKCTAFTKKLKSSSAWEHDTLLKDVATLNLTRYIEEVVANVLESKPKVADIPVLCAFCVAMHERYEDFLTHLLTALWDGVQNTNSDVKTKRLNLRILTEFLLIGLLQDSKQIVKVVTEASGAKDNYSVVQDTGLIVAFAKSAGFEIFGKIPTSVQAAVALIQTIMEQADSCSEQEAEAVFPPRKLLDEANVLAGQVGQVTEPTAVDEEVSQVLTKHCLGAYQFMVDSLVQTHNKLLKLEKRCEQDRILSGTLPEAREKGLADARKLKENLEKSVEAMSDALDQPVPHLEEQDDDAQQAGAGLEVWTKGGGDGDNNFGPFDDEETRDFYCDIPDLLATIPPALLGMTPEQIERRKEENLKRYGGDGEQEMDEEAPSEVIQVTEAQLEATEDESMDQDGKPTTAGESNDAAEEENKDTPHYRLMTLLDQELPECHRREQIDELTERFCTNHGSSKNARKRLNRTLFLVPRTRLDLLPYYSRMTATVDRIWPDVGETLVTELEQQFHGQTKFRKNLNIDSRFRTARYIGELTKFRVAPPIVFLRCLRRCLDDFTGSNVDVVCCLLESSGRFIYRLNPQANSRLTLLMETTTRLSKARNLDERSQSLIKSAFYSVNPPKFGPRKKAKQYPPLETYLRHLLLVYLDPSVSSVAFVAKQLVRFPWGDPSYDLGVLVTRLMLKACRKGRYKTIHAIAAVAERIRTQRRAGEITVRLIDSVFEELRWALEHPDFRDQQRVLTYTRLLGELYVCNQISGQIFLQQLYDCINLGHEIPDALREASKKLAEANDDGAAESTQLPVYNSATGISQTIQEEEELEDSELDTKPEQPATTKPKPVVVSEHSKYDPRVPTPTDPPNSAYRIKLVCALLEVASKSVVSRGNLPRLKGFLTAFQRYLFTKTMLPADVEFSLLDTFDVLDSRWRQITKGMSKEDGFPRFSSWLDAHVATVAIEESGSLNDANKMDQLEAAIDVAKSGDLLSMEGSMNDDESASQFDDEESIPTDSASERNEEVAEGDLVSEEAATYDQSAQSEDDDETGSSGVDSDEDIDEEEFDEEAYMKQLEEEAFERELRKLTMDAIEKGKNVSRKQVAEYMPSGSQISVIKKKTLDPTPAQSVAGMPAPIPSSIFALGGKAGINFQLLKKGNKGKVEAKAIVVPVDTNLAQVASRKDDEAARERDLIKQRVLQYEAESANAEYTGGNVYLEQEKLQVIRNRLSMEDIDKNFGTSGGNLRQVSDKAKQSTSAPQPARRGGGRGGPGRGGRGSGGRANTGGRTLFG